jgi:L-2-hydroxyglutarate oxidase LhgO
MPDLDVVIVGGGVVGLSCAYELAARGRRVAVLEQHARFGEETSTHNSGVIHAGIYYPPGSLKARLCVEGRRLLTARLRDWRIPHRLGGKLIVATHEDEIAPLERLKANGERNEVEGLVMLDRSAALRREPNINVLAALFSPVTGVFDVGAYLHTLAGHAQAHGALLIADAEVQAIDRSPRGIVAQTRQKGAVTAARLVNAAGLHADTVARLCGDARHTIHPCRGEYATVIPRRAGLINDLVYPLPSPIHLEVHFTKTVDGELWLGPNVKWITRKDDYESDRRPPQDFLPQAQRLCPTLCADDLRLGPSGIRPKRHGPNEPMPDFFIERQPDEPRIVHLVGIESPGLTASPAIARHVADWLTE